MYPIFKKIQKSLPFQLLIVIGLALLVGPFLDVSVKASLYAISLTIKEVLVFVLPFIIFSLLFSCLLSLHHNALRLIVLLLISVCLSTALSAYIGYGLSHLKFFQVKATLASNTGPTLTPYWSLNLPSWIKNQYALGLGLIMGLVFSYFNQPKVESLAENLKKISTLFLNKIFIPIVPLFVLGFVIKLDYENIFYTIIKSFGPVIIWMIIAEFCYLSFLYAVATRFNPVCWINAVSNVLPSAVAGFTTMSSAASMPLTLRGAEDNTGNPSLARVIIPATVNIHLIGDGIIVPIMALAILMTFGIPIPDFMAYSSFVLYFVLAKFAIAGVPGGGVIVMIPILESCMGFNTEMSSLMTALYILLDPVLTSCNITGNGAFAMLFNLFFGRWFKYPSCESSN